LQEPVARAGLCRLSSLCSSFIENKYYSVNFPHKIVIERKKVLQTAQTNKLTTNESGASDM
jgi:hypothetical protein